MFSFNIYGFSIPVADTVMFTIQATDDTGVITASGDVHPAVITLYSDVDGAGQNLGTLDVDLTGWVDDSGMGAGPWTATLTYQTISLGQGGGASGDPAGFGALWAYADGTGADDASLQGNVPTFGGVQVPTGNFDIDSLHTVTGQGTGNYQAGALNLGFNNLNGSVLELEYLDADNGTDYGYAGTGVQFQYSSAPTQQQVLYEHHILTHGDSLEIMDSVGAWWTGTISDLYTQNPSGQSMGSKPDGVFIDLDPNHAFNPGNYTAGAQYASVGLVAPLASPMPAGPLAANFQISENVGTGEILVSFDDPTGLTANDNFRLVVHQSWANSGGGNPPFYPDGIVDGGNAFIDWKGDAGTSAAIDYLPGGIDLSSVNDQDIIVSLFWFEGATGAAWPSDAVFLAGVGFDGYGGGNAFHFTGGGGPGLLGPHTSQLRHFRSQPTLLADGTVIAMQSNPASIMADGIDLAEMLTAFQLSAQNLIGRKQSLGYGMSKGVMSAPSPGNQIGDQDGDGQISVMEALKTLESGVIATSAASTSGLSWKEPQANVTAIAQAIINTAAIDPTSVGPGDTAADLLGGDVYVLAMNLGSPGGYDVEPGDGSNPLGGTMNVDWNNMITAVNLSFPRAYFSSVEINGTAIRITAEDDYPADAGNGIEVHYNEIDPASGSGTVVVFDHVASPPRLTVNFDIGQTLNSIIATINGEASATNKVKADLAGPNLDGAEVADGTLQNGSLQGGQNAVVDSGLRKFADFKEMVALLTRPREQMGTNSNLGALSLSDVIPFQDFNIGMRHTASNTFTSANSGGGNVLQIIASPVNYPDRNGDGIEIVFTDDGSNPMVVAFTVDPNSNLTPPARLTIQYDGPNNGDSATIGDIIEKVDQLNLSNDLFAFSLDYNFITDTILASLSNTTELLGGGSDVTMISAFHSLIENNAEQGQGSASGDGRLRDMRITVDEMSIDPSNAANGFLGGDAAHGGDPYFNGNIIDEGNRPGEGGNDSFTGIDFENALKRLEAAETTRSVDHREVFQSNQSTQNLGAYMNSTAPHKGELLARIGLSEGSGFHTASRRRVVVNGVLVLFHDNFDSSNPSDMQSGVELDAAHPGAPPTCTVRQDDVVMFEYTS